MYVYVYGMNRVSVMCMLYYVVCMYCMWINSILGMIDMYCLVYNFEYLVIWLFVY